MTSPDGGAGARRRRPLRRPASGRRRTSLRRIGGLVFGISAAVLIAAMVVGAVLLQAVRADRDRLLDHIDPAVAQLSTYQSALIGESTGARSYSVTGQRAFLEAYRSSAADARRASARLTSDLPRRPDAVAALATLQQGVAAWRARYVMPLAAGPGAGRGGPPIEASTSAFSGVRHRFEALGAVLTAEHRAAVDSFDGSLALVETFAGTVLAAAAVLLALLYVSLRRTVLAPLVAVGEDSRRVGAGDLDHAVAAAGPAEIAELADTIDGMRAALVADLHELEAAHAELAAQEQTLAERGEELARSNRDLEQFAYVASHDLQEPLRKVASFCQLLADRYGGQLDERGEQYIAFAVDGAKRMQTLVNDLLAFSRVGRNRDRWGQVDLAEALAAAETNLERRLVDEGATVTAGGDLPTVRGDRTLLTALWQNLLGNSIKFRGDDPPAVTVSCRRDEDHWALTVADNGIGIEPQYAERVFTIFQRLHARDRYEGTGIGLALCRRIVEFHGGTIAVDTDATSAGGGTSIRFTLPVDEDSPEEHH